MVVNDIGMLICTVISVIVSGISLIITLHEKYCNTVNLETVYRERILSWHSRCLNVMMLLKIDSYTDKEKRNYLAQLSALIEEGRFFFPNIDKQNDFGNEKPVAYRGYRCSVLEYLVRYYDLVRNTDSKRNEDFNKQLETNQRKFTSGVFEQMNIKVYIKKMEKITKTAFIPIDSIEDKE